MDGKFILRIEDTDLERSERRYEEDIVNGLQWLGIDWDNTDIYRQSERLDIYRGHLRRLMDEGKAVWRVFTEDEKAALVREGRPARDRVIVLKQDDARGEVAFEDDIRGRVAVQARHVGQVTLAKDEDTPLYNFAVVVDDVEMKISHVIRGEDHISNTPKQLLIYEALGAELPRFAHLPLILGPDRSKLSKRHGVTSVAEYRRDYLPDALVNFMALLGHTYESELLTRDELVAGFSLDRVHKSGAVFDTAKLGWMNSQYVRKLTPDALRGLVDRPAVPDAAVPFMTERLERLSQVDEFSYFWDEPSYDAELLIWKKDDAATALRALGAVGAMVARGIPDTAALDALAASEFAGSRGSVYWPLRVALSGRAASVGPLDIAAVIGAERTAARISTAVKLLS
jgi:glutamyl/glutaminyl-tRNA synthetase